MATSSVFGVWFTSSPSAANFRVTDVRSSTTVSLLSTSSSANFRFLARVITLQSNLWHQ